MFVYENSGEVYVGGGIHLTISGHHRSDLMCQLIFWQK